MLGSNTLKAFPGGAPGSKGMLTYAELGYLGNALSAAMDGGSLTDAAFKYANTLLAQVECAMADMRATDRGVTRLSAKTPASTRASGLMP